MLKNLVPTFILLFNLLISIPGGALASDLDDDKKEVENNWKFIVSGEGNSSLSYQSQTPDRSGAKLEQSFITLGVEWKKKIRAVITSKLEHIFKNNFAINDQFNITQFVREAFIEIREIGGKPVAIIIGKHPIAFGQGMKKMPIFSNNPLFNEQSVEEVIGLTIDFDFSLWKLFDKLEVSVFESKKSDLEIGRIDGMSVRLSKLLFENWMATFSHSELGNNHLESGHERRSSIGLVGKTRTGTMIGWFEGMYFSNNPNYPKAMFALTIGTAIRATKSNEIVVELNWVQNHVMDIGVGWVTYFFKSFKAGAEVRYRSTVEREKGEIILGLNLTYIFGNEKDAFYKKYLFGDDDEDDSKDQADEDKDEKNPGADLPTIGDQASSQNIKSVNFSNDIDETTVIPDDEVVAYFKNKKVTFGEIGNFIENSKMTDADKIALFEEARGSFPQYLSLKNKWIEKRYSKGIKQFLYYKIIQAEGMLPKKEEKKSFNPFSPKELKTGGLSLPSFSTKNSSGNEGSKRQGFLIGQEVYQKMLKETENNVLKELLDKNIGIQKAKSEFGNFLIAKNYPHKYREKSSDVYERWYRSMALRLYEELREREVSKFEIMVSAAHLQGLIQVYESDAKIFYKNLLQKVKGQFAEINLDETSYNQMMAKNPEYQIVISEIKQQSLENSALSSYKNEDIYRQKIKDFQSILEKTKSDKLFLETEFYIKLAFKYSKKYKNKDELLKQQEKAFKLYQQTSEIPYLTLTRVYAMAISFLENAIINENKLNSMAITPSKKSFEKLAWQLTSKIGPVEKHPCFDLLLYNCLVDKFEAENENPAAQAVLQFSRWYLTEAVSSSLGQDQTVLVPTFTNYDSKLQKKIMSYLLEAKYHLLAMNYRQKLQKNYLGQLRFKKTIDSEFSYDSEAMSLLFQ